MKNPKKLPKDPNKLAHEIMRLSTEEPKEQRLLIQTETLDNRSEISKYLAEIGRKGGLKGGNARAAKLSAKKRKEIAQKAASVRWHKKDR
jgi:hypothetical protein